MTKPCRPENVPEALSSLDAFDCLQIVAATLHVTVDFQGNRNDELYEPPRLLSAFTKWTDSLRRN